MTFGVVAPYLGGMTRDDDRPRADEFKDALRDWRRRYEAIMAERDPLIKRASDEGRLIAPEIAAELKLTKGRISQILGPTRITMKRPRKDGS